MLDNWVNSKVKEYLESNIEKILGGISDETIGKLFDKARDSIIESRHYKIEAAHLKGENFVLRQKNEELQNELDSLKND